MSNIAKEKYISILYLVTIDLPERPVGYLCFAVNHQDALQKAMAGHSEAARPLPFGTRCIVQGQCHDPNCDCGGKYRTMVCFTYAAGAGGTC